MAKAEQCFLLIGGNCDLADGSYVNCFNPFNGEKYFLSRSFLEKASLLNKGYFHIENPGVCVTDDNRIFVAGGVYVFHKYKMSKNSDSKQKHTKTNPSTSSHENNHKENFDDYVSLLDERDFLKDGIALVKDKK